MATADTQPPRDMYARGKIYKITSSQTCAVYIGSTVQPLSARLSEHKGHFRIYAAGKGHYYTSFEVVKYTDASIELIEDHPCEAKYQLEAREAHWIQRTPGAVNKYTPSGIPPGPDHRRQYEQCARRKARERERRAKPATKAYRREYNRKPAVKAYKRQYYQENRDRLLALARLRYKAKKAPLLSRAD